MNDLEKAIKGTEICLSGGKPDRCRSCPYNLDGCDRQRMQETLALLKDQPEIVRCDKCTMRDKTKRCHVWGKDVKDDDYCSYGERKKGKLDDHN